MDIITLRNRPKIISAASVGGSKEKEGPLGEYLDLTDGDARFGQDTFEQAESEMQRLALNTALAKAKLGKDGVDVILAGDLVNQCTSSTYGLINYDVPYLGLFGACSTMAEGILIGSMLVDGGYFTRAAAVTSSHFCTAERQFRSPIEYGGQRTPTSQWTVTGSGAFILGMELSQGRPTVTQLLPGIVVDKGITDANNMGAAMAPAAVDTLYRYFTQSGKAPGDFDLIATGDLGHEGEQITRDLLSREGINLGREYHDCGCLVFDAQAQQVNAGGSGCGCSAIVAAGFIMNRFATGAFRDVLLIGTGALMSPLALGQGLSIPAVAHLVRITADTVEV